MTQAYEAIQTAMGEGGAAIMARVRLIARQAAEWRERNP